MLGEFVSIIFNALVAVECLHFIEQKIDYPSQVGEPRNAQTVQKLATTVQVWSLHLLFLCETRQKIYKIFGLCHRLGLNAYIKQGNYLLFNGKRN
jgi:hypothetical protein